MKFIIFVIIIIISTNIQANRFAAEPACFVPNKPLFFSPRSYTARYHQDVKEYRDCIYRFIEEQEQAINLHQESIRHAKEMMKLHVN